MPLSSSNVRWFPALNDANARHLGRPSPTRKRLAHRQPQAFAAAGLSALTGLSSGGVAIAQQADAPTGIDLAWEAPAVCDARARTLDHVEHLLGHPLGDAREPMRAVAKVAVHAGGGWRLVLTFSGPAGDRTRELTAGSCAELSDAAALILALALDPTLGRDSSLFAEAGALSEAGASPSHDASPNEAGTEIAPRTEASEPDRDRSSSQASPPAERPASPDPARHPTSPNPAAVPPSSFDGRPNASSGADRRWSYSVGAGPVLVLGAIPLPALGVAAFVAAARKPFRVELAGFNAFERFAHTQERPTVGGHFGLWSGTLSGCYVPLETGHLEAGGCVLFEGGVLHATGAGVDHPEQATRPWFSTGISGLFGFSVIEPLTLLVEPSLQIPWGRPEFEAAGLPIYRAPELVGGIRWLLEVRIF